MKGDRKRRRTAFAKGIAQGLKHESTCSYEESPSRQNIVRVDTSEFRIAASSQELVPGTSGELCDYTLLRPKKTANFYETYKVDQDANDMYALYHQGILSDFWNHVTYEHRAQYPHCFGYLQWCNGDSKLCERRGLVWAQAVKCDKCVYISEKQKFYKEVITDKVGRKAAAPNIGLQVGLARQGIGPSGLIDVLSAANVSAPSRKGLQAAANTVSSLLEQENIKDMHDIREQIKHTNTLCGNVQNSVDVECDGTYSTRYAGSSKHTPFQAATQASYIMAENVSEEKKIISAHTYSKLCCCDVSYSLGPHKSTCSQNLPADATIGYESRYMEDCLADLQADGLNIEYLTLDGDSKARKLAAELINPCEDVTIKPQYCTLHLTRALISTLRSTLFSPEMFPGTTKKEKDSCQRLFTLDISSRVTGEYAAASKLYEGDTDKLINKMSYMTDTVIKCYESLTHAECCEHSLLCSAEDPYHPYIDTCTELEGKFVIQPTDDDRKKLHNVLEMRFSPRAVRMTRFNRTQNKWEAANRGIKKATPSHITFARNYAGRVHAAVHSMNNKPGVSLIKLCDAVGASIPPQSPVVDQLQRIDAEVEYHQKRKSSAEYTKNRAELRKKKFQLHDDKKQMMDEYSKHRDIREMLLRSEPLHGTTDADHSYTDVCPTDRDHGYSETPTRRIIRGLSLQSQHQQRVRGKMHVTEPGMDGAITARNLPP